MGVPVLALFRENKIRESQYYCHSQNLKPSKFMPYTVCVFVFLCSMFCSIHFLFHKRIMFWIYGLYLTFSCLAFLALKSSSTLDMESLFY